MLSTYLENAIWNHILGGVAYSPPGTMQLALFTSSCTDDSLGTEVSGGGYSRASITNNSTNWAAASSAGAVTTKANAAIITFPALTASWGSVTHWALMDGSNILCHGAFTTAKTFVVGEVPRISIGALVLTAPAGWSNTLKEDIFDHVFGQNTAHTPEATYYLGLCTAAQTDDIANITGEVEVPPADGYARFVIANNTTNFPSAASGVKDANPLWTFGAPTAAWAASASITHWVLMKHASSLTNANFIMWGALSTPFTVTAAGDTPSFASGDFVVTLD